MKRHHKRVLWHVAIALIPLGGVTSVVVAWVCAIAGPAYQSEQDAGAWLFVPPPDWPTKPMFRAFRPGLGRDELSAMSFVRGRDDGHAQKVVRVGFPARCLTSRAADYRDFARQQIVHVEGTTPLDRGLSPPARLPLREPGRALPVRPIWEGLALNTALYALLWGPVFAAMGMAQRYRPYCRGLCPNCRYNRKADYSQPCPECGHGMEHPA